MNKKIIEGSQGNIAILQNREDGFPIVFIHGNSLASDIFISQFKDSNLSEFRLIALDLPGHGDSFKSLNPENDYSPNAFVKVLVETCTLLNATNGILVGHSFGGHLAIEALPHLKKIKGILIAGTPPLMIPPQLDKAFLPSQVLSLAFKADLSDEEKKLLASHFVMPSAPFPTKIYDCICKTDPPVRHYIGRALIAASGNNELQIMIDSHKKIALLHGEYDQIVNLGYLYQLPKSILWNRNIHLIKNAGHTPPFEQPSLFNVILKRFVNDCIMEH